jgi:hypothetical protein
MGSAQALSVGSCAAGPFDYRSEWRRRGFTSGKLIHRSGRVVIGSAYGNTAVQLNLGIDFHRATRHLLHRK